MSERQLGFDPISHDLVADRAVAQCGIGTYGLGHGGRFDDGDGGERANAFDDELLLDCSGLLAFCARYRRGPYNTDGIIDDCIERVHLVATGRPGKRRRFRLVGKDERVRRGDFIVKPGKDLDHNGVRDAPGHCGVIVEVLPEFVRGSPEWWLDLLVAHCSGAGQNRINPETGIRFGAVRVMNAAQWALAGYIVRPLHVT